MKGRYAERVGSMLSMVSCLASCTPAPRPTALSLGPTGIAEWRAARAHVGELASRHRPAEPYSMNLILELDQPHLGRRMRARGAVAVRPPEALRMILLGPGGTTALDLWVCRDEFRFAVPAIDLERRGDARTPDEELRGLPVAFLSWWFLRPFDGRLLSFSDADARGRRFVIADGADVIHLLEFSSKAERGRLSVERLSNGDEESMDVDAARCGTVRYRQRSTGLDIEVRCESLNAKPPPARAFADPDAPHRPTCSP